MSTLRSTLKEPIPFPGAGNTACRHQRLMETGQQDLSLARLAEGHWDALAILDEAGRQPAPGAIYAVWAAEVPGSPLTFDRKAGVIRGRKVFCSGALLVDRALITVSAPGPLLVEIDLRAFASFVRFEHSSWKTTAFAETNTSTGFFDALPAEQADVIGDEGWYLRRPGFWHGACGPAACWAGGAIGLVDYAMQQSRRDAHTLAHLGAMQASAWALRAFLLVAGNEIDADPDDTSDARIRALTTRHLVEQGCTEVLRRLPRAYGPRPLATDESVERRYHELDLYLRQSHAERDLEALGEAHFCPADARAKESA